MITDSEKKPIENGVKRRIIKPGIIKHAVMVVYLLGLSLLLGLGGWQIGRGLEKNQVEKAISERQNQPIVIKKQPESWGDIKYKMVQLDGNWLAGKTFLLDNRVYQGKTGYELLNPIQLSGDGSAVLVNLGWVEKQRVKEVMSINARLISNDSVESEKVTGQLYLPDKGFTLGAAYTNETSWPKIIQYFDQAALSKALGVDLGPAVVVLDSSPSRGLIKIWSPYVVNASRHFGYAFQWWGLALTLIIFGIIWRRNSNSQF
ncbi:SURF1 family protein [Candidatus Spongiihabitans sp.]|uniref:SURF1 family protein n=1 Tax=Candidatus Spongiihabitans sp. TaxID=3101308 RepID=UPI003C6FB402